MTVKEKGKYERDCVRPNVRKTTEDAHPGVKIVQGRRSFYLAAPIELTTTTNEPEFESNRYQPAKTREVAPATSLSAFAAKGWSTVAAFQTRNPLHRSH